jgi:monofunctional biosynthetic peptidoglycan transglycosylase
MKRLLRILFYLGVLFTGSSLFFVLLYKWMPVNLTPLMVIRCVEQALNEKPLKAEHRWIPGKQIPDQLRLAVICSEDQNFFNHNGFDFDAIRQVVKESESGSKKLRGASTISQQSAKNLFLWPGRSWLRKGLEVWFTALIERFWSKERILNVYLNVIETGDGIYGAQAAAKAYFGIPASRLSTRQSAAIAAILPNPLKYSASNPGPYVSGRISWIMGQMQQTGPLPKK